MKLQLVQNTVLFYSDHCYSGALQKSPELHLVSLEPPAYYYNLSSSSLPTTFFFFGKSKNGSHQNGMTNFGATGVMY